MKTIKLLGVMLLAGALSAFAQKSDVKINQSSVKWEATKVGGAHNGDIKIKSGYLELKNGSIAGGKITIDMNKMTCADITDAGYNKTFIDHLKSDDFFSTAKYPVATFDVTKATPFKDGKATVTGTLTIKGKSETVSFDVVNAGKTYTAQLKVDRSKYDVRYGSKSFFDDLGDKFIDDIFTLDIKLAL